MNSWLEAEQVIDPPGIAGWLRAVPRGLVLAAVIFGGLGLLALLRLVERPLFGLAISPVAFAVRADSPHKTVGDVVAAAKKENRPLQLGNYSAGYQLVAAWLGTASGLPVTHIPYKGGAQMLTDVIGGALEVGVIDFTGTIELLKGGKLRVLAITAPARDAKFPDIPTMKESGFADFETSVWSAFFMRAETSAFCAAVIFRRVRTTGATSVAAGTAVRLGRPRRAAVIVPLLSASSLPFQSSY